MVVPKGVSMDGSIVPVLILDRKSRFCDLYSYKFFMPISRVRVSAHIKHRIKLRLFEENKRD